MDTDVWLRTSRLVLRGWRAEDREPFARLNADPEVMAHFPAALTRDESDATADRIQVRMDERGFGLWALEVAETGAFIGFTGLSLARFPAHFTPAVEVGWRLARHAWGRGYATEAARAAVAFGFDRCGLEEIVSFTARTNVRSQAVMRRLGMRCDSADDFDHPELPSGHRLGPHVLYRLAADDA
ncbi:GNAT family acetyltransferase [Streptomonospora alba]|uniref:GNAT family acetyltransferase n=1 Tax=Streptomonospora alba TaxID=183763 RepID=A0A0C2JNJ7_9ACTN|nr:GNAT family N-acetyltransferase [Streptomonospora alba]KIH98407.1 GNAT family acetyltransferase [Streptomonospora alba]